MTLTLELEISFLSLASRDQPLVPLLRIGYGAVMKPDNEEVYLQQPSEMTIPFHSQGRAQ